METHEKVWGREEWLVNNRYYCAKLLFVKKGYCCSLHYHYDKDETFILVHGKVVLEVLGFKKRLMGIKVAHRIPPKTSHRFFGLEDSVILEISTPHFEKDSFRDTKHLSGPFRIKGE